MTSTLGITKGCTGEYPYIQCGECESKSYSPGDIEHLYCSLCGVFHEEASRQKVLPMWVVYERPEDNPTKFVARLFFYDRPTSRSVEADTLEEVRNLIPDREGMVCFLRDPSDPIAVVETWT